jgi:cation-transporting ATPase E
MRSTRQRHTRTARAGAADVDAAAARAALPSVDLGRLSVAGLSDAEVALRVAAGLTNRVPFDTSRSFARILQANLLTLFNAVVGGSFLLLLVLGYWRDALFGFFVIANVLIGVTQEFRAKRTLDRLALLNSPRARVLRGGAELDIPRDDVVLDDTLVLRAGDQLPADAVILHGQSLEIDESLLTGEADPVLVAAGREVLSASAVVGGHGAARVVRIGSESYASRITAEARRFTLVNSELRNELNRVVKSISWALIPISAVVVNGQIQAQGGWGSAFRTGEWREAALASVASIVSTVPQGLVFMTSVAFAVGAVKLARRQVLVQELAAVEGLARVDIVCLDKTGTLTEGGLVLDQVAPVDDEHEPGWERALGWFGADPNANATAKALGTRYPAEMETTPAHTIGFSSSRKWSAASFDVGELAGSWVLGAPEMLTPDSDAGSDVSVRASELAASGLRTLLLTLFFRYMPDMIRDGRVYAAVPPLHRVIVRNAGTKPNETIYTYSEVELNGVLAGLKRSNKHYQDPIQRYKGLGEMDADQLATTTMDRHHRTLRRVQITDAVNAERVFELLMGNDVAPRKDFIIAGSDALSRERIDV